MKLFRSSQNKSQASLPSSPSRSNSPDQASEAFYPPPQQLQQHDSQIHSHPAHVLSRPSIDLPVPAVYEGGRPSQPSITTTIPSPPQADPTLPPQTQFGPSRSVHVPAEKENRRSKRSLFGLTSSSSSNKDKDKENSNLGSAPAEKKGGLVGRSGSIHLLRKHNPLSTSVSGPGRAPAPDESQSSTVRHSAFLGKHSASQDDIIREEEESASSKYEQGSVGPPSPVVQASQAQVADSRPSSARFSAQSVGQATVQVQTMARDQGGQNGESREDELRQYHQDSRTRMAQQLSEQGHSTPPPQAAAQSTSRNRDDPRDMDFNQLVQRYEELQAKYSKVKRYYFEREAQVTQLQNTVATQRLSMSKTSLDDAQYQQRFERLSGAINNLAFNIRKDWKHVIPWLRAVCNQDAHTTGTKEMTAMGRACISRWLAEQVFDRVFHPALPQDISRFLKATEKTLRRQGQSGILLTEEQRDDLTTKITTWRLTTMEGLSEHFNGHSAAQNQEALVNGLTEELTQFLKAHLNEPAPAGLQEGVGAIVQLAINIAANMPLESRDVCVEYFLPGEPINETYMKLETGMMPLTHPGLDERLERVLVQQQRQMASVRELERGGGDEAVDGNDLRDVESAIREAAGKASQSPTGHSPMSRADTSSSQKSGQKNQNQSQRETGGGVPELTELTVDDQVEHMRMLGIPPLLPGEGKVRFAAFFAVDVRGKMLGGGGDGAKDGGSGGQGANNSASVGISRGGGSGVNVLIKAPVYEL
ncbi:hypothetical protein DV736_g6418, partial [Chaetothyriales sp. CBS 134916]